MFLIFGDEKAPMEIFSYLGNIFEMKSFIFVVIVLFCMIFFWRVTLLALASLLLGGLDKSLGGVVFIVGVILLIVRHVGKREGHI
ncbi:MAG: hypothetical protein JNM01_14955 [Delftia acidovorans]|nr:hypothetical protein [Delftia acidovorans]